MSTLLQALTAGAIGVLAGTVELAARHPADIRALVSLSAARWYLGVNFLSGVVAFAVLSWLEVTLLSDGDWARACLAGVTGLALLRTGHITDEGLQAFVQRLVTLSQAFGAQLAGQIHAKNAEDAWGLTSGLDWNDSEALTLLCVKTANPSANAKDPTVQEILDSAEGFESNAAGAGLPALAVDLQERFGPDVLKAAVDRALIVRKNPPRGTVQ